MGRASSLRGGGTAIYYDTKFMACQRHNIFSSGFESVWLELSFPNKSKILISSVYRPPNSDFDKFKMDFEDMMEKLSPETKETIIIGDLNCDISSERLSPEAKSLGQLVNIYQLNEPIKEQ
jgi:exonuclease III